MFRRLSTLTTLAAVVLLAAGCSDSTLGPNLDAARAPSAASVSPDIRPASGYIPGQGVIAPTSGYIPGQGTKPAEETPVAPSSGYIPGQGIIELPCDVLADVCP